MRAAWNVKRRKTPRQPRRIILLWRVPLGTDRNPITRTSCLCPLRTRHGTRRRRGWIRFTRDPSDEFAPDRETFPSVERVKENNIENLHKPRMNNNRFYYRLRLCRQYMYMNTLSTWPGNGQTGIGHFHSTSLHCYCFHITRSTIAIVPF